MGFINRSSIPAWFVSLVALWEAVHPATAQQTSWSVSNAGDLTTALAGAFANNVTNPSLLNTITLTGSISGSSQWIVNANVNIVGNGYTIDMNNVDRAFFIAGGTVGISNLAITNGNATGGFAIGGGARELASAERFSSAAAPTSEVHRRECPRCRSWPRARAFPRSP